MTSISGQLIAVLTLRPDSDMKPYPLNACDGPLTVNVAWGAFLIAAPVGIVALIILGGLLVTSRGRNWLRPSKGKGASFVAAGLLALAVVSAAAQTLWFAEAFTNAPYLLFATSLLAALALGTFALTLQRHDWAIALIIVAAALLAVGNAAYPADSVPGCGLRAPWAASLLFLIAPAAITAVLLALGRRREAD